MHAPTELQADVLAPGNGIGTHLQFLLGGDARIGMPQVCRANAAAGQQRRGLATLLLEQVENQRNRVEGSQVAVQHARYPFGLGCIVEQVVCRDRAGLQNCLDKKRPGACARALERLRGV
ncbi:hypothetical protein D3C79_854140 [compost metagenome]